MPLFRKQVITKQQKYIWGEVNISRRVSVDSLFIFFASLFICFVVFLFVGEYNQKLTFRGVLQPSAGIIEYHSPLTGTVSQIFVKEGEKVKIGQPLFSIIKTNYLATGLNNNTVINAQLAQKKSALNMLLASASPQLQASTAKLKENLQSTQHQYSFLTEERALLAKRIALSNEQVKSNNSLSEQLLLNQTEKHAALDKWLILKHQLNGVDAKKAKLSNDIKQLQIEISQLHVNHHKQIQELRLQVINVEQQLSQQLQTQSSMVTATIDGTISNITINTGTEVVQNQYLTSLIPLDSQLIAHLFIPAKAIGLVSTGDLSRLKLDAFPFQQYGIMPSTLTSISKSLINTQDTSNKISIPEPYYQSTAVLASQFISVGNKQLPLYSGMTFTTDVVISKRTLAEWLFEPFISALR